MPRFYYLQSSISEKCRVQHKDAVRAPLHHWLHPHLVWLSFAVWTLICAWSDIYTWSAYMHLVTKPVPVAPHLVHLHGRSIKDSRNLLLSTSSTSLAEGCPFHAVQNLSTHHEVRRCLQAEKPQWQLLQDYEDHGYVEWNLSISNSLCTLYNPTGLTEPDIKLVMDPKNSTTLTLMKNKDASITYITENTMAPHMNLSITLKVKRIGDFNNFCLLIYSRLLPQPI